MELCHIYNSVMLMETLQGLLYCTDCMILYCTDYMILYCTDYMIL